MRILHVITSLQTGGAERLMVDLLPLLRDKGNHDVELLVFDGTKTPFMESLEEKGIRVHKLSSNGNVYHPSNIKRLVHYISSYDIIHTHNTACQYYVPIAKRLSGASTLLVTTEHNSTNRRRTKWWFKPIDRWIYNQYASIVCISDQTCLNLLDYYQNKDIVSTIYNGVDISRFMCPVKSIEGKSDFLLTMVAAFREQKDYETLLKAMKLLPECYHLQIVGNGERGNIVKQTCDSLGLSARVEFLGVRQDIPEILEASDVIVLSSHWEGLSLSSIEGMASGRPFVASDVDGLREIVSGAGILFPHGDENALAREIQKLCENPEYYRKTAVACQERAKQYDISVMAKKYNDLYKTLIN